MTASYDVGFEKETDWSGDKDEGIEVLFCDKNLADPSLTDCFVFVVDKPSEKKRIDVTVWQGISSDSLKNLTDAFPLKKGEFILLQAYDNLGEPDCFPHQEMTGDKEITSDTKLAVCSSPNFDIFDGFGKNTITSKSFRVTGKSYIRTGGT